MASPSRLADNSALPLISSLVASVERLPDLMDLGTPNPVLVKNRRPILTNFVIPTVRFRVGTRTVAVLGSRLSRTRDL